MAPTDRLRRRIEAEYRQLPRLRLTVGEAALLFDVDTDTCASVFQVLIGSGLLRRTPTGNYVALPTASGQLARTLSSALQGSRQTAPLAESWLFARNGASVRLVRMAERDGRVRLELQGPDTANATYTLSFAECLRQQAGIEQALIAQGFQLRAAGPERRSGRERRQQMRGPERRRP